MKAAFQIVEIDVFRVVYMDTIPKRLMAFLVIRGCKVMKRPVCIQIS